MAISRRQALVTGLSIVGAVGAPSLAVSAEPLTPTDSFGGVPLMASIEEKLRKLRELGANYLKRIYPGESLETWNLSLPTMLGSKTESGSTAQANAVPENIIWTSIDETDAPAHVHAEWAVELTREVPDWRRENVQIYPFITGQRVNHPGDESIQDMNVSGYVVEQTGIGTTLDGKPYRVQICHVMFVKDGKVVRNHQYWGGADTTSMALTTRTLDKTRGEYRRHLLSTKWRGAPE